ncbi:MAG: VWA domain-containing protein [Proteobacteria bacterium]|nr:VWA domain-containing protein [Pseudomonadota bacterium]
MSDLFFLGLASALLWSIGFWGFFNRDKLTVAGVDRRLGKWFFLLKLALFFSGLIGWALLCYSLTQPREPLGQGESNREVIDIALVVDVSRSMLAEDLLPNRLEATKRQIREFAKKRITDRIALIIFSEKVFTLLPLSTDPELLDKVISDINIGFLGSGTNIGDGLGLGVARLMESETKNRVIVLLTDGVNNVGNLTPLQSAEQAKENGIKVYTIGVGSAEDAKIPMGKSVFGTQYQLIPGGSIDYETLKKISDLTGGKFYPATDEEALEKVFSDIDKLERTEIKLNEQIIYKEHYYKYFISGFLLLLLAELLKKLILKEAL